LDKFLVIAVFLIAVAQVLTILLTFRRERDLKRLGELVDKQRLQIVELRAWLAGRNAAQPRSTKAERDNGPMRQSNAGDIKVSEPAVTPKDSPESNTTEEMQGRATKAFRWFKENADEPREIAAAREIAASVRAGLDGSAAPSEPTMTAKDLSETMRQSSEDEAAQAMKVLNWQREIVAGLRAGLGTGILPTEPTATPKDLSDAKRPDTSEDEFKRATRAINWLKEDAEKPREIAGGSHATPPAKKIG
jgi:hypothetical protein